jgi:hypothetical protein
MNAFQPVRSFTVAPPAASLAGGLPPQLGLQVSQQAVHQVGQSASGALTAAQAMSDAIDANGYRDVDVPIYMAYQSQAGLKVDGFPGLKTIGSIQRTLAAAGMQLTSRALRADGTPYPWSGAYGCAGYDGTNAPTLAEWCSAGCPNTGCGPASGPATPVGPIAPVPMPSSPGALHAGIFGWFTSIPLLGQILLLAAIVAGGVFAKRAYDHRHPHGPFGAGGKMVPARRGFTTVHEHERRTGRRRRPPSRF